MPQTLTHSLNNELNQDKFKLVFTEIKNTEILCTGASIPGVDGTPLEVPNPHNRIYVQGKKLNYSPLTLTFKVDENLETWKEIYGWVLAIYAPQSYKQYADFQKDLKLPLVANGTKFGFDASLFTLKNSMNVNLELHFRNLFPISLSSIDFTTQSSDIITATATFQYDNFLIR